MTGCPSIACTSKAALSPTLAAASQSEPTSKGWTWYVNVDSACSYVFGWALIHSSIARACSGTGTAGLGVGDPLGRGLLVGVGFFVGFGFLVGLGFLRSSTLKLLVPGDSTLTQLATAGTNAATSAMAQPVLSAIPMRFMNSPVL